MSRNRSLSITHVIHHMMITHHKGVHGGQAHPAHGHDLDGEGVLVVVIIGVLVVGHQLLVVAVLDGHHALHEVDELERVRAVAEEEVHALPKQQCRQVSRVGTAGEICSYCMSHHLEE